MSLRAGVRKHWVIAAAVTLWIPAVAFGINILWKYSTSPGHPATPPLEWPSNAPVQRAKGRATLVMFAHPQCQCTRASLGELALLMAREQGRLDAKVYFYFPSTETSAWAKTDLWQTATGIPGVQALEDREAAVAQSFGVFTSGQALLYDDAGRLLFKGGITASRGHSGDNAGRSAIAALLENETARLNAIPVMTPVFGCSLRGE